MNASQQFVLIESGSSNICKGRESIKRLMKWAQAQAKAHKSIEQLVAFICKHYKTQWKQLTNVMIARRTYWNLGLKLKAFVAYDRLTMENCTQRIFSQSADLCRKRTHSASMRHSMKRIEKRNLSEALQIHYGLWILSFPLFYSLKYKTTLLLGTFFTLNLCWTCLRLDNVKQYTTLNRHTCSIVNCDNRGAKQCFETKNTGKKGISKTKWKQREWNSNKSAYCCCFIVVFMNWMNECSKIRPAIRSYRSLMFKYRHHFQGVLEIVNI